MADVTRATQASFDVPEAEGVRRAHRRLPTGLMVVTALDDDGPRGLLVNSFASITMEPPTVVVSIGRSSRNHGLLVQAERFGVNVLAEHQPDLLAVFSSRADDKFAGLDWARSPGGVPALDGCVAFFEIATTLRHELPTHTLLGGTVTHALSSEAEPLVYLDRTIRTLEEI